DGETSHEQNPIHTYKKTGKFEVNLVVTDNDNKKSINDFTKEISVIESQEEGSGASESSEPTVSYQDPVIMWTYNTPHGYSKSAGTFRSVSPAISDNNTLYIACDAKTDPNIIAIDIKSGTKKWDYQAGNVIRSSP